MERFGIGRHKNFYIALGLGVLTACAALFFNRDMTLVSGASVFFLIYLVLTWIAARKLTAEFLRNHAVDEDEPAPFILLVMLAAVIASTVSLFLVVIGGDQRPPFELALSVASVFLSWFAVHTMWAMHYAYEYYKTPRSAKGGGNAGKVAAGLDFHSSQEPSGVAFVYFAYVIGMTAQTADVDVVSNAMRRLVLVQSVFAFFFNTGILAAAVNIAVALAQR